MAVLSKEPLTTLSAVLFMRQANAINDEINRTGESRAAIIRRLVDRGLEAEQNEREQATKTSEAA